MNDQQVKDILFISIIHMLKSNREELEKLQNLARKTWGEFYILHTGYWGSTTELQINRAVANIDYCHERINETICLN